MNEAKNICAFYSRGPHYLRVLKHLRREWPDATLTALVPPGYPHAPLEGLVHHIHETARAAYSLRDLSALATLKRQISAESYDVFTVMFDSVKLRLLARLSGAPQAYCHTVDGRFFPLPRAITPLLARTLIRRIRGRITYAYIYHVVHHRRVPMPPETQPKDGY